MNWDLSWQWLNLGNVFSERINWIQWYEYTGVFGGSLWVLCSNLMLFTFFRKFSTFEDPRRFYIRIVPRVILISIPILISFIVKPNINLGEDFKVLITQPRIDPWDAKSVNSSDNLDYFKIFKDLTDEELDSEIYLSLIHI